MNVSDLIDPAFSYRLIATLMHFLWQGCLVALLAVVGDWLLNRASAGRRYALHVAAMGIMVACVAITFSRIESPVSAPAVFVEPVAVTTVAEPIIPSRVDDDSMASTETPAFVGVEPSLPGSIPMVAVEPVESPIVHHKPPDEDHWRPLSARAGYTWAPQIALLYFVCCGLLLARLIRGTWVAHRLRRMATTVSDDSLIATLQRQAQELGLRVLPRIAWCAEVSIPLVIGVLKPMILLPAAAATGLSADQLQALITHELAHIRRYDLLVNMAQRVVESMLFFHPAVWFISRRISNEREQACDELVLATGCERLRYADALVRMAELSSSLRRLGTSAPATSLAAAGANSSEFKRRVLKVLSVPTTSHMRPSRIALLVIVALICGATISASRLRLNVFADTQPTNAADSSETQMPPVGLEFLKPYPKLHGLSLDMTEPQFLEIVKQQELKTRKTIAAKLGEGEQVAHQIALGDGHTLIVMFDKVAKCSGIQRVRGDDDETARLQALQEKEKRAIAQSIDFLRRQQLADGRWPEVESLPGSITSLALCALLQAGVAANDPAIQKGLKALRTVEPNSVYVVSLQTMAFCLANPQGDAELIRRNVKWLQDAQNPVSGGWRYQLPPQGAGFATDKGDGSNSRFAVLALHQAAESGFEIPAQTWQRIRNYWIASRVKDGGWCYQPGMNSTATMTCSGIASLAIVHRQLEPKDNEAAARDEAIRGGLAWLTNRFSPTLNPTWFFYHAHCLERAAHLNRVTRIGEHDWRPELVAEMLKQQQPDGSFVANKIAESPLIATSLALMTLSGRPAADVPNTEKGLGFLKSYLQLHGLSLDMTEPQFLEIVKQQELKTRKTVEGEKVTHHITLGDGHLLIVMFDKDGKCCGIQRVRGEEASDQPAAVRKLGAPAVVLPDHLNVMAVGFDRDSKDLVSAAVEHDVAVRVWDLAEKKLKREVKLETDKHGNFFLSGQLTLSGDRKRVLAILDGKVMIWDAATGKLVKTLELPEELRHGLLRGLSCTPDLSVVACGREPGLSGISPPDAHAIVWDVATGKMLRTVKHTNAVQVQSLALSPDGKLLATGGQQTGTCLWDVGTGTLLHQWPNNNPAPKNSPPDISEWGHYQILCLRFSPDGQRLALGDMLGVKMIDVKSGKLLFQSDAPFRYGRSGLVFSKDGQLLARIATDKVVPIWSAHTGKLLAEVPTEAHDGCFSGDGRSFAVGFSDSKQAVAIWQLQALPKQEQNTANGDSPPRPDAEAKDAAPAIKQTVEVRLVGGPKAEPLPNVKVEFTTRQGHDHKSFGIFMTDEGGWLKATLPVGFYDLHLKSEKEWPYLPLEKPSAGSSAWGLNVHVTGQGVEKWLGGFRRDQGFEPAMKEHPARITFILEPAVELVLRAVDVETGEGIAGAGFREAIETGEEIGHPAYGENVGGKFPYDRNFSYDNEAATGPESLTDNNGDSRRWVSEQVAQSQLGIWKTPAGYEAVKPDAVLTRLGQTRVEQVFKFRRIRWAVRVEPEKKKVTLGEPLTLTFFVKNATNEPRGLELGGDYRNRIGRPESFEVRVINNEAKPMPVPDAGPTKGGLSSIVLLKPDGETKVELKLSDWATITQPGNYRVFVKRTLKLFPIKAQQGDRIEWGDQPEVANVAAACEFDVIAPRAAVIDANSEPNEEGKQSSPQPTTSPPVGLEFLKPYPKLHGLSLNMTEPQFLEIVKQQELKTRKTVDGEKVTHHIALGDDHTLIVMFDKDAKCSGIQRVRGEDEKADERDSAKSQPQSKESRALFQQWQRTARANGNIPGGTLGPLVRVMRNFVKNNPTHEGAPKFTELLKRIEVTRDWSRDEAVKLLDEVAAIYPSLPDWVQSENRFKLGGDVVVGKPLPEELKNAPWGEGQPDGLRVAWLLEPRALKYRLGTPLKSRILFHNAGKNSVVFRALTWNQSAEHKALDAQGTEININSTYWTTIPMTFACRLAPGEFLEVVGAGIGVGANTDDEDWRDARRDFRVGSWIEAKAGDEVTFSPAAVDCDARDAGQVEGEEVATPKNWWSKFIKDRVSLDAPLPAAADERRRVLDRAVRDLFGNAPTPEEITAFITDAAPEALDALAKRLANRDGFVPFSGSLKSGTRKFLVLPPDPDAAKKPRSAKGPGQYKLGGATFVVTRRPIGERVVNEAHLSFSQADATKPARKSHPVPLPDGYDSWIAAWMRVGMEPQPTGGGTVLWVAQKGADKKESIRRYDFTNPDSVKETVITELKPSEDLPQAVLDALSPISPR